MYARSPFPHRRLTALGGYAPWIRRFAGLPPRVRPCQVHKLPAGEDDVNSVLLAMPRPRGRARSGPLVTVVEHALASATVSRK